MKLARIGPVGAEKPAAFVDDDTYVDLSDIVADFDESFFADGGIDAPRVRSSRARRGRRHPALRRAADRGTHRPTAPDPVHRTELQRPRRRDRPGRPDEPILFTKSPNTLVGPDDDVRIPRGWTKPDWEVELGIVIGKRASYLDARQAATDRRLVVVNDVSERAFQIERGGQWSRASRPRRSTRRDRGW